MAASTTPNKRAQARRAPAKKAAAPAPKFDAPSKTVDISDVPEELQFESTAYTKREIADRPKVDLAYTVKHPETGEVIETLRLTARRPNDGFLQLIGLDFMTAADGIAQAQACLQFAYGAFDPMTRSALRRRMYNPEDSFEMEHLMEIATKLLTMWGVQISRDDDA